MLEFPQGLATSRNFDENPLELKHAKAFLRNSAIGIYWSSLRACPCYDPLTIYNIYVYDHDSGYSGSRNTPASFLHSHWSCANHLLDSLWLSHWAKQRVQGHHSHTGCESFDPLRPASIRPSLHRHWLQDSSRAASSWQSVWRVQVIRPAQDTWHQVTHGAVVVLTGQHGWDGVTHVSCVTHVPSSIIDYIDSWSERSERSEPHPVYLVYLTSLYFVEFVVQFVFVDIAGHSLKFIQIPSNVWLEEWVLYLTTAQLPET